MKNSIISALAILFLFGTTAWASTCPTFTNCNDCLFYHDANCTADNVWCAVEYKCINMSDIAQTDCNSPKMESCPIYPNVTSAVLSITGIRMTVTFSRNTDIGTNTLLQTIGCGRVFTSASVDTFGPSPTCQFTTAKTVRVTFGKRASIRPGTVVTVLNNITDTTSDGLPLYIRNATVQLPPTRAKLQMNALNLIVPGCKNTFAAVPNPTGPSRDQTYITYTLLSVPEGNVGSNLSAIAAANTNKFTFNGNVVNGTGARVPGTYKIQATANSIFGFAVTRNMTITASTADAPTAAIATVPDEWFVNQGLAIVGQGTDPCNVNGTLKYRWTVSPTITGLTLTQKTLTIPPFKLVANTNYTVTLTVAKGTLNNTVSATFFAKPVPLKVVLTPLSTTIGLASGIDSIVFNGSKTTDPNFPSATLTYKWSCQLALPESSSLSACPDNLNAAINSTTTRSLTLATSLLDNLFDQTVVHVTYNVSSSASGQTRSVVATLKVIDDVLPFVEFVQQISPAQQFKVLTVNNEQEQYAILNVKQVLSLRAIVASTGSAALTNESLVSSWTATRQEVDDDGVAVGDVETVTLSSLTTYTNRTVLTVRGSRLSTNYIYTFTVSVRFVDDVETATSVYEIWVNQPPFGGELAVSDPHNDDDTYNVFEDVTLEATGWFDLDSDSDSLEYAYGYYRNGRRVRMRAFSPDTSFTTPNLGLGSVLPYVVVRDIYGSTTQYNLTSSITVTEPTFEDAAARVEFVQERANELEELAESDPEAALSQTAIFVDVLDSAEDANQTQVQDTFNNMARSVASAISSLTTANDGELSEEQVAVAASALADLGEVSDTVEQSTEFQNQLVESVNSVLDGAANLDDGLDEDTGSQIAEALDGVLNTAFKATSQNSSVLAGVREGAKKLVEAVAKSAGVGESVVVQTSTMTLVAQKQEVTEDYELDSTSSNTSLTVPSSFLTSGGIDADDGSCESVGINTVTFTGSTNPYGSSNSSVLDLGVQCTDKFGTTSSKTIANATTATEIAFSLSNSPDPTEQAVCVFYDSDNNNEASTSGLTTVVTGNSVTCSTTHLTPFTVEVRSASDSGGDDDDDIAIGATLGALFGIGLIAGLVFLYVNHSKKKGAVRDNSAAPGDIELETRP